jgi:hypothetical protein
MCNYTVTYLWMSSEEFRKQWVEKREKSPRTRATRIKPRVERALPASATLGPREESRNPTAWALDTGRRCSAAGPCCKSKASVTRSAGSMVVSEFPRVPLRASLRSALRFTPGFIRIARIRGLTLNPSFQKPGCKKRRTAGGPPSQQGRRPWVKRGVQRGLEIVTQRQLQVAGESRFAGHLSERG